MTPLQAANAMRDYMAKKYEDSPDLIVWDKEKCAQQGFGSGDAALIWEGGPYDWAVEESMAGVCLGMKGILAEPYNGFILNFYAED